MIGRLPFQAWFNKPGTSLPVEADFKAEADAIEWLELMAAKHYPFGKEDGGVFLVDAVHYEMVVATVEARKRIENC